MAAAPWKPVHTTVANEFDTPNCRLFNPKPYSRHYLLRYDAYGRNHKRGRGRSKRDELAPVNAGDAARPKQPFSYMRGYRNAREKNPYRW
jgi:hypothetical protein